MVSFCPPSQNHLVVIPNPRFYNLILKSNYYVNICRGPKVFGIADKTYHKECYLDDDQN